MTDPHENEVDAFLHALGTAEPTPNLDARILSHLNTARPRIAKAKPKLSWGWAVPAFACAALLVAALVPHTPPPVRTRPAQATILAPTHLTPAPGLALSAPTERVPIKPSTAPQIAQAEPKSIPPSRGLADLPSQLAPPEPLTPQERHLARVASGPGPDDFALLNPETRALLAQQSAAAFDTFFPPDTPQEIYLATHLSN